MAAATGSRAVGADDQLRGLHLDLEAAAGPAGNPAAVSYASQTATIASTWLTVLTFGKVITRLSGRPPCSSRVDRKRSRVRRPRRRVGRLEALEPQADEGRGPPGGDRSGQFARGPDRLGVLDLVAAIAVAVLEVEPQVLDRLGGQLGLDPRSDRRDQVLASDPTERQSAASPPCAATRSVAVAPQRSRQVDGVACRPARRRCAPAAGGRPRPG